MLELESRVIATNLVERLRARGHEPFQIQIQPNGSGISARVGFPNGLAIESHIPPGYFDYDRVAETLCHLIQAATMESD